MKDNRDFKGVWIPKDIWLNKELTLIEKIIFVEIDSLDNDNHCTAGNEYFAEFCNCSESKVTQAIKKLQELNMIEILNFDGRHRTIRVVKNTRQSRKIYEAESQKIVSNNIVNNKDNKQFISKDINCGQTFRFGTQSHSVIQTANKEVETFKDLYNKHCYNLPTASKLTDERIKAINKLIKKYSVDDIIKVFDTANESDFLRGKNDRGWKANIDFILREDKFVSILEGKYNGKASSGKNVARDIEHLDPDKMKHATLDQKKQFKEDIANGTAEKY